MSRRMVYGDFSGQAKTFVASDRGRIDNEPEFALEIVHEPSASQLVGKLYRRSGSGDWVPAGAGRLETYPWYQQFHEKKQLRFDMEGSGPWEVLHFRIESDETGPYVALALQYAQQQVAVG